MSGSPPVDIAIEVRGVSKTFVGRRGSLVRAVRDVSFRIVRSEFVAVVGASGSGKSTLLKVISGIEAPSAGSVQFGGERKPRLGFVFQSNVLMPWRTVARNLEFPLELRGVPRGQRAGEIRTALTMVGLDDGVVLEQYPDELSGGQARRVALGVALSNEAEVLFLDEPTSQLDYKTKRHIQELIGAISSGKKLTTILVTHDLEEALLLADRVLVLRDGALNGGVEELGVRPRDRDVLFEPRMRDAVESLLGSIG